MRIYGDDSSIDFALGKDLINARYKNGLVELFIFSGCYDGSKNEFLLKMALDEFANFLEEDFYHKLQILKFYQ